MAEVAYITATQAEKLHRRRALQFYGTASDSRVPLFVRLQRRCSWPAQRRSRSIPYDPQFRGASDLYNQSLEGMIRLVRQEGELRPGISRTVTTANNTCSFEVCMHSTGWHSEDIDRLGIRQRLPDSRPAKPLSHLWPGRAADRRAPRPSGPRSGRAFLSGEYLLSGHGVSSRRTAQPATPGKQVTAAETDRIVCSAQTTRGPLINDPSAPHFVLELYDSLDRQSIEVADRGVPLEADLSTPLAYFLNQPQFKDHDTSTIGLLRPGEVKKMQGLYMLEPFDSSKMPVVMVHGLWSSPITWMEMYNDLRSDPEVRKNYQFWFYLYPDRPAVLDERDSDARRSRDDAPRSRSQAASIRRSMKWCSSATAWAA